MHLEEIDDFGTITSPNYCSTGKPAAWPGRQHVTVAGERRTFRAPSVNADQARPRNSGRDAHRAPGPYFEIARCFRNASSRMTLLMPKHPTAPSAISSFHSSLTFSTSANTAARAKITPQRFNTVGAG